MLQKRRSKSGDQEPTTRPIYLNSLELAVLWLGKATERLHLFNAYCASCRRPGGVDWSRVR